VSRSCCASVVIDIAEKMTTLSIMANGNLVLMVAAKRNNYSTAKIELYTDYRNKRQ
jgi:hypothetical protein